MLAAAAPGPSQRPAITTRSGWSVRGTGVPGSGIATCEARASATAKPTTPTATVTGARRAALGATAEVSVLVICSDSLHAEGHRVAAAEAERREPGLFVPVTEGVQQGRQHARATGADR